jgi:transposase
MDKNHVTRKLTVKDFFKRFPDEDACLEHIMTVRFGHRHTCQACGVVDATFHRLQNRKAYACAHCGDNLYPCAGTIFEKSRTPLQVWFYAIFLFISTRHGVSGMELHRQLGVTRKTGYRMGQQIRQLMDKADIKKMLSGHVELDEAYVGGRRPGKHGRGAAGKTILMGLKERGGYIRAEVIPDASMDSLANVVRRNVKRGSIVSTDEFKGYTLLKYRGFQHATVNHSEKEYAVTDDLGNRVHVNGVENFWKLFKSSVRSTHIHISSHHMQKYVNEFTFRQNHREMGNAMFDVLIAAV